jgi:hypothetical protein
MPSSPRRDRSPRHPGTLGPRGPPGRLPGPVAAFAHARGRTWSRRPDAFLRPAGPSGGPAPASAAQADTPVGVRHFFFSFFWATIPPKHALLANTVRGVLSHNRGVEVQRCWEARAAEQLPILAPAADPHAAARARNAEMKITALLAEAAASSSSSAAAAAAAAPIAAATRGSSAAGGRARSRSRSPRWRRRRARSSSSGSGASSCSCACACCRGVCDCERRSRRRRDR